MEVSIERNVGWLLDKVACFSHDRNAQLNLISKFEMTVREDSLREASKLLLDHKHESTTDELIDMLNELADKAEDA